MVIIELDNYSTYSGDLVLGYLVTDLEICRGHITVDVENKITEPNRFKISE
jgi:hypothetical protein